MLQQGDGNWVALDVRMSKTLQLQGISSQPKIMLTNKNIVRMVYMVAKSTHSLKAVQKPNK